MQKETQPCKRKGTKKRGRASVRLPPTYLSNPRLGVLARGWRPAPPVRNGVNRRQQTDETSEGREREKIKSPSQNWPTQTVGHPISAAFQDLRLGLGLGLGTREGAFQGGSPCF